MSLPNKAESLGKVLTLREEREREGGYITNKEREKEGGTGGHKGVERTRNLTREEVADEGSE